MTHPPIHTYLALAVMLAASTALIGLRAEPPAEAKKEQTDQTAESKANEQTRRQAERVVRNIEMQIWRDDKWTKVEQIKDPVLNYSDPTRGDHRGTVWGWGAKGRPVALLELWQDVDSRTTWYYTICNTSGGKVRARYADAPWWDSNESATELKDVPGAPAPADEASVRQRQLKLLAAKFSGHEFWNPGNTRYELRLLKRPLYTYRDEANGLLEGGLFTLANGTNPEIMLFVEARVDAKNQSKRVWQYAAGRLAHAELHLEYKGKEVFDAPRGDRVAGSDQPYWLGVFNVALDVDLEKP